MRQSSAKPYAETPEQEDVLARERDQVLGLTDKPDWLKELEELTPNE